MDTTKEIAKFFLKLDNPMDYFTYIKFGEYRELGYFEEGWYFSDETWTELIGPYVTFEECFRGFHEYCKELG